MPYKINTTGRWAAQGRDANGKRVQLGTHPTKRDAAAAEAAFKRRRPGGDTTVAEWRTHWLTNGDWQESTRTHYAERTKRFAEEHGKKRLGAVNRTLAREFYREHASSLPCLTSMFGAALYEDDEHGDPLLQSNPFAKLVKQKAKRRDLQSEWLTAEDVDVIEETAFRTVGAWAAAMVRFAAETGIRPGELFLVGETDLYPEEGLLAVRWAADSKLKGIKRPKNGRAREIVLSHRAASAATALTTSERPRVVREVVDKKLVASAQPVELELTPVVFTNPRGGQFWNSTWTYYWHPIRAAAGRPDMDFYELRHYCATRLLEAGLDYPDVAEQLGHTDGGELVRTTYGHPSRRRALDRVRRALNQEDR